MLTEEIWMPVPFNGLSHAFEVSSEGRVRRIIRSRKSRPRILSGVVLNTGYRQAFISQNKVRKKISHHQLVMLAFVGPAPKGCEINHIDGDKLNNRLSNLEYVTRRRNIEHSHEIGRGRRLEQHGMAKLTVANVLAMRERRGLGESMRSLAREFGVSKTTAAQAIHGKTWKLSPEEVARAEDVVA